MTSDIEAQVEQLFDQAELFANGALTHKLFTQAQADMIHNLEQHSPEQLFNAEQAQRPLVVAFFGGTGVGKSTLLNRFADQSIARTGVERPTSREVTIYVHQSVEINQLPKDFPLDKVSIRQHQDQSKRQVMWIDMPDIDSVESDNLKIVRDWIPFIDVLLYVVSPERYRDDRGWQFLLKHGYKHAWMFVMNQRDQGDEHVDRDFRGLLESAGFEQPMLYQTDCLSSLPDKDDFERLLKQLLVLANDHTIAELDRRGIWNRVQGLQALLQKQTQILATQEELEQLDQFGEKVWSQATSDTKQHLELPIQLAARHYTQPDFSLFDIFRRKDKSEQGEVDVPLVKKAIWDERSQAIVGGTLDKIILFADGLRIPAASMKERVTLIEASLGDSMNYSLEKGLTSALATPGSKLHRLFHKLLGNLTTLLPLAALSWIAYRVFSGFYADEASGYLGVNFAIHSLLLVLVAWLIPYILHKKFQPSLQKAAKKGLEEGLDLGLADVEVKILELLSENKQLHQGFLATGESLITGCMSIKRSKQQSNGDNLARILQKELHRTDSTPKI